MTFFTLSSESLEHSDSKQHNATCQRPKTSIVWTASWLTFYGALVSCDGTQYISSFYPVLLILQKIEKQSWKEVLKSRWWGNLVFHHLSDRGLQDTDPLQMDYGICLYRVLLEISPMAHWGPGIWGKGQTGPQRDVLLSRWTKNRLQH